MNNDLYKNKNFCFDKTNEHSSIMPLLEFMHQILNCKNRISKMYYYIGINESCESI